MPAINQISPAGFLGLFQLKNFGQAPSPMEDGLKPVLDLTEWYLQTQSRFDDDLVAAVVNATASFRAWDTPVIVPADEWWYVSGYRVTCSVPALLSIRLVPSYLFSRNSNAAFGGPFTTAGGASSISCWDFVGPWWLPPGAELGVTVNDITAGNYALSGSLRFTRMKV